MEGIRSYLFKKIFSEIFREIPCHNNAFVSDEIKTLANGLDTYLTLHRSNFNLYWQLGLVCKNWMNNLLPRLAQTFPLRIVDNQSFKNYLNFLSRETNPFNISTILFDKVQFKKIELSNSTSSSIGRLLEDAKVRSVTFNQCVFECNEVFSLLRNPNVKEILLRGVVLDPSIIDTISNEIVSCSSNRSLHFEMTKFLLVGGSFNLFKVLSHPNAQLSSLVLQSSKYQNIKLTDILQLFEHSALSLLSINGFKIEVESTETIEATIANRNQQNMSALKQLHIEHLSTPLEMKELFFNTIGRCFDKVSSLRLTGYDFKSKNLEPLLTDYISRLSPTLEHLGLQLARIISTESFITTINNLPHLNSIDLSSSSLETKDLCRLLSPTLKHIPMTLISWSDEVLTKLADRPAGQLENLSLRTLWTSQVLIDDTTSKSIYDFELSNGCIIPSVRQFFNAAKSNKNLQTLNLVDCDKTLKSQFLQLFEEQNINGAIAYIKNKYSFYEIIMHIDQDNKITLFFSVEASSPPTHLYAFAGQLADQFLEVDLTSGNYTMQNAYNPYYIFGVAKTTSSSMLILSSDFQLKDDALISYNYANKSFTEIGHIQSEVYANMINQPLGFDESTMRVMACGQTKDTNNVTIFVWDFVNNTGITYPLPHKLVYPFPVGGVDTGNETYYVLYGHTEGMMLSTFLYNQPAIPMGTTILFPGLRLMTPGVIIFEGQVYFIDTTFYYYDIYFVDVEFATTKRMIRINNSFDKMTNVFPFASTNEYIVLVTSTINDSITYTILNLITLETTSVTTNQTMNRHSNYVGVY
ncbi:hypothetical protein PPL_06833 [Heterostelium album PN500]|uniref:Uncharacterized protein n=1 Tax=Heterostelium pallidum (strain ATCC 26659 / Pp 5 / PN500) TaxID=670386 RepID=D3BDN1_HETP5|nr:hypothetical protein PPL_06833 [Heterostelium album PN500]EFA80012.1 hypothetical protein PPL_06833 [Heterostelium album PN500]|eukprot:XP_020432132.1 hypothetical protein PPL_06833 [Heterostelium album PN500]